EHSVARDSRAVGATCNLDATTVTLMKTTRRCLLVGMLLALSCFEAQAQMTFTPLGDLPGGTFFSEATAVSADGLVVVGVSNSASGREEAFRWTRAGGMVALGDLPGGTFQSVARHVS